MSKHLGAFIGAFMTVCVACGTDRQGEREATHSPPASASQTLQFDAVQRVLQLAPDEKVYIDSMVAAVHDRFYAASVPIRGEIHRLGPAGARRYLLVASLPESGKENVIRFLIGEPGKNLSAPSPMRISDEIDRFAIDTIGDFDGDGLADVGYCTWLGARGTPGSWSGVGFRGDSWYQLTNTTVHRRCEPQAEP